MYDALFHMPGCDQHKCFALDFEFANGSGSSFVQARETPAVQVAFAYSTMLPGADRIVRRLRVITESFTVARSSDGVWEATDPEVVTALLAQKLARGMVDDGEAEAQALVKDWATVLAGHVASAARRSGAIATSPSGGSGASFDGVGSRSGGGGGPFDEHPRLSHLSQLVFGLVKNPLLDPAAHPDTRVYLQCLFAALHPVYQRTMVYPTLTAFKSPEDAGHGPLALAGASVVSSSASIYMVSGFVVVGGGWLPLVFCVDIM